MLKPHDQSADSYVQPAYLAYVFGVGFGLVAIQTLLGYWQINIVLAVAGGVLLQFVFNGYRVRWENDISGMNAKPDGSASVPRPWITTLRDLGKQSLLGLLWYGLG